jgi:hypothetical protein
MKFAIRLALSLLFPIVVTIALFFVENRSNLPAEVMIPIIVSLLTKYVLGDWDEGFQWSFSDVAYWASLLGTSYGIVRLLKTG